MFRRTVPDFQCRRFYVHAPACAQNCCAAVRQYLPRAVPTSGICPEARILSCFPWAGSQVWSARQLWTPAEPRVLRAPMLDTVSGFVAYVAICGLMEPFGTMWNHMGPYEPV